MASFSNKIDISNSKIKNKESEVEVLSIIDKSYFNKFKYNYFLIFI